MLHFHIVTLFPDSIEPYLKSSIIGKAREKGLVKVSYYDPKKYTHLRQGSGGQAREQDERVDRRPYGGGPGMVLRPEPMLRAASAALKNKRGAKTIFFSTAGKVFDEAAAKKLAKKKNIVLVCGRYEGVDARVRKILKAEEVSVGPYVLTGGELPAATLVDAIARFVPGVLGKAESLEASRVSSPEVYTRPEILVWKGKKYKVPQVLLSGDHRKIEEWKTKTKKA